MNWMDILMLVVVAISVFFGVKRGLIKEIFALLALILGIIIASRSYAFGGGLLVRVIPSVNLSNIIGFIVIFFLVVILLILAGRLLKELIQTVQLGWIDRIGGVAFGLFRGAVVVGVALTLINKYPILGSEIWVHDSSLASFFIQFIAYLWGLVPPHLSGAVAV